MRDLKKEIILEEKYEKYLLKYEYRISYSDKDKVFIGSVAELPSCMGHGESPEEALEEIKTAARGLLECSQEYGDNIPEPLSLRKYTGKFMTRISPEIHRKLVKEAHIQNISLNSLISNLLAGYVYKP